MNNRTPDAVHLHVYFNLLLFSVDISDSSFLLIRIDFFFIKYSLYFSILFTNDGFSTVLYSYPKVTLRSLSEVPLTSRHLSQTYIILFHSLSTEHYLSHLSYLIAPDRGIKLLILCVVDSFVYHKYFITSLYGKVHYFHIENLVEVQQVSLLS